jgi:methionyl-tRNA formyltransferase
MKTSLPLIFFGTEDFSAVSLIALLDAGFDIRAVVTKPDFRRGRGKTLQQPRVKQIAEDAGIPVLQPAKLADITNTVASMQPIAGVLVSYGKIIPQSIIDLFTPGIINVHPSLLPKYRGPSPIETAILHGDPKTGVTIMRLNSEMDAGPLYTQITIPLMGTETKSVAYDVLGRAGARLLVTVLPRILDGSLQPQAQEDEQATYCSMLRKDDGRIDPEQHTASFAERMVRAYQGFPKTKVQVHGHDIIVLKARVASSAHDGDFVFTLKDGTYLEVVELMTPNGRTMDGAAYLRGYQQAAR